MAARHDNLHSRLVAWLKVILPLAALVVLSTLFLVSRTIDPSDAIPLAGVDVEDRAREPRMTAPTWAGLTDDGAALTVTAAEARPGQGGDSAPSATGLRARLETPDGSAADLVAATGRLDDAARLLHLGGGVVIDTTSGYHITSDAMTASLDQTDVKSDTALAATGPLGQIEAGSMRLTESPDKPGTYLLGFGGNVKLIYDPKQ
ncbi:lipopolysaccharide export system protein LptC [Cereibacter ovatus]|uniref:Lipopolysaccharide export system protein LptC n=1 Tax=Cereibacter ovatus TaxID=439529 RepID=A0A285CZ45_9RHOB|nr:LPS export ABC transporter periplasmic protein LptC [Cereibacter ovatus]SNX72338.1 lipopolysaccharide export system protein LptC [Cereibacter ovatus]